MKNILFVLFLFFLSLISVNSSFAQFIESFDDNELTSNPTWNGDLNHFTITNNQRLQLNAPSAGTTNLYTNSTFEPDYTWQAEILLAFSPSKSNRLEYFFMVDKWEESSWNGYSFEIGEDGSKDGLTIYRWDNGTPTEIAKGEEGKLGSSPANLKIKIERINNVWTVYTNYENSTFLTQEFSFTDNTHSFENGFTGLRCHYTATRKDKFLFDNLINAIYTPDTEGPLITEFTTIDNKNILLYFNELIAPSSINKDQITINPSGSILSAQPVNNPINAIQVEFTEALLSGPTFTLSVNGIKDLNGNIMSPQDLDFFISETPSKGDLFISEVLFDPVSGGSDFIELYNRSNKILNLENIRIENSEKDAFDYIEKELIVKPNEYIALSPDINHLKLQYSTPDTAYLATQEIPSLNISSGNVSIINAEGILLDSFNYLNEWHYSLLESTKGVSLERISFDVSSTIPSNWFSGTTSTNYATPGYKNANSEVNTVSKNDDILSFDKNSFSPNQDGQDDLLVIRIKSEIQGSVGSITIYNVHGVQVRDLANNVLLSNQDQFIWNGLDDQGNKCKIGHYIVVYQGFNTSGKKETLKKAIKLLDFM